MPTLKNRVACTQIGFGAEKMFLELSNGKVIAVPYNYTKRLSGVTKEQREEYELIAGGIGIRFPQIDEDISIDGVLRDFDKEEVVRLNISLPKSALEIIDNSAKKAHLTHGSRALPRTRYEQRHLLQMESQIWWHGRLHDGQAQAT